MQVPLRVYTRDGKLIAAIGEQRRIPVRYDQLPKRLIQAFLATEDDRFFQHHGVDWQGILRAALANLKAGRISQGASTITMQVSRDMFLTPKRDMKRKMSEVYISLLMEAEFTKEEIFTLYVNKIFLGQRAYGVGAAAEVYFGKSLDQLTLAEMATLAGIPTAPSVVNPVASPELSRVRRAHVLGRMLELNYISQAEYDEAKSSPVESRLHGSSVEAEAPYVAEMVRNEMQAKYGDAVYTAGYKVFTTIDSRLQAAATVALRTGLLEYDHRHGYRGATAKVDLSKLTTAKDLDGQLEEFPIIGGLRPAIVQKVEAKSAKIYVRDIGEATLPWEKLSWARRELPDEKVDRAPSVGLRDPDPRRRDLHRGSNGGVPAVRAGAGGAKRSGGGGSARRRDRRSGRRIRLFSEQIQSGDAGASPTGLGLQALHICGCLRQGIYPGERHVGRAGRHRRDRHRAGLAAEGNGRQFRGSHALARSDGAFAKFGVGAADACHRRRLHLELRDSVRLRQVAIAG